MSGHLTLTDLSVSFGGFKAVNGLTLEVGKGELRCLIGPNGAGKTTALDLICGKTKPTGGSIQYQGKELARLEEHLIARAGVGRKFQVPSVFRQLTVSENLEVAYCKRPGVFRNLFHLNRSADTEALESLAEFVGMASELNTPAAYLSHGQTQWLEIALLLAQECELILLDEPTAGMTVQETQKTADICNRLKGKNTIIVVEHDMGFVREIGDVISVMHQGTLLAEGSADEVSANPQVKEVYLGSVGIGHA
nr:urea ABC transporter ATP-binding protein UrtD [uncultured Devosia sp.]